MVYSLYVGVLPSVYFLRLPHDGLPGLMGWPRILARMRRSSFVNIFVVQLGSCISTTTMRYLWRRRLVQLKTTLSYYFVCELHLVHTPAIVNRVYETNAGERPHH